MAAQAPWRSRIVGHGEEAPDQLLANPRNWRVHPRGQQQALAGVLTEVGWVQDVIVNRTTGHVVDGHARVSIAISRSEPTVPVVYVELSPEEEAKVLATFDPLGAMAGADREQLEGLLREVRTDDAALRGALRDLADTNGIDLSTGEPHQAPEAEVDRAEELRAKWGTAPGQLWEIGRHRLLCGDATKAEDVGRLMAGERAVLMATDPPYFLDYQGGNHPQSWSNKPGVKDKHWDDYEEAPNRDFYRVFLRTSLEVALLPNPAVYQWFAALRAHLVLTSWEEVGLLSHQSLVWVKARSVLTHSHYMWQHEPCLYGWPRGKQPSQRPPANASTVWQIDQQGDSDGLHPTQKPVEIFRRPIEYHTTEGALVYEPFSGSGTQFVAAEQLGRRCAGLELAPEYVGVTLERLSQMGLTPRRVEDG